MRLLAIEWNDVEARVAVAGKRGMSVVVEQAFAVPLRLAEGAPPAEVGTQIAAALSARGLGRLDALVSVGRASIELRQFTVPPAPDAELPDLVRFQAMREFAGLQEEWPLDFVPLDRVPDQPRRVLAAAIDPDLVCQIQAVCQAAGLKARRLLLRPCAAASLLERRTDVKAPPARLLVDLLGDEADLTVLVGGQVVFLRTTRLPGDALTQPEAAQALVGETRRTLAAAHNQLDDRVQQVVVCGAGNLQAALAEQASQQLGIPVELFNPFAGLNLERSLGENLPERPGRFAPLLGMLLDELSGSPHAVDFLHPRRRPEPPSRRTLYTRIGLGAGLAAVLVFGGLWWQLGELEAEAEGIDTRIREMDADLAKAGKIEQHVAEIEKWQAGSVNWLDELHWLSQKLPSAADAKLTRLQASSGTSGGELSLEGLARAVETVSAMEQRLCDKSHQLVGKDKTEDKSTAGYSLSFRSSLHIEKEDR